MNTVAVDHIEAQRIHCNRLARAAGTLAALVAIHDAGVTPCEKIWERARAIVNENQDKEIT